MSRLLSMLAGAGRLFDFSGSYGKEAVRRVRARRIALSKRNDLDMLRQDWCAIGSDIRKAMEKANLNAKR